MSVRVALVQTLASRQATVVVGAVAMVVLARLLTPADFGVFAIAMAAFVAAGTIAEFGLKWRLIQAADLGEGEVESAVGLSLVLSLAAAAALGAAALLFAGDVGPEGLAGPLAVLATALLIGPVIMPLQMALERELHFGMLSVLAVFQAAIHAATVIGLALAGYGAMALAAGTLVERLATAAALLIWLGRGRLPRPRFAGWGRFRHFGLRAVTTQLLPRLGDAALMATLGWLVGVASLGLFNRADKIVKLFDETFIQGIQPVILPAMSRSLEGGMPPARLYLLKIEHLTGACWPAFAVIAVLAGPLVGVLLGPQWEGAVPVVQALSAIGVAQPFTAMSVKFFVAIDRLGEITRIDVVHQVVQLALAAGGAAISLEAACLGVAAALSIKAIMVSRALKAAIGYDSRALARILARSAAITASAVAGPILLLAYGPEMGDLATLLAGGAVAAVGWLVAAVGSRHPLVAEALLAVGATRPAAWMARP